MACNWFTLIGAQRSLFTRSFVIGEGVTYRARRNGELWCFRGTPQHPVRAGNLVHDADQQSCPPSARQ